MRQNASSLPPGRAHEHLPPSCRIPAKTQVLQNSCQRTRAFPFVLILFVKTSYKCKFHVSTVAGSGVAGRVWACSAPTAAIASCLQSATAEGRPEESWSRRTRAQRVQPQSPHSGRRLLPPTRPPEALLGGRCQGCIPASRQGRPHASQRAMRAFDSYTHSGCRSGIKNGGQRLKV